MRGNGHNIISFLCWTDRLDGSRGKISVSQLATASDETNKKTLRRPRYKCQSNSSVAQTRLYFVQMLFATMARVGRGDEQHRISEDDLLG
jgi:hypothetical protein